VKNILWLSSILLLFVSPTTSQTQTVPVDVVVTASCLAKSASGQPESVASQTTRSSSTEHQTTMPAPKPTPKVAAPAQDYHLKIVRTRITNQAGQQFACVAPYTTSDCEKQVVILQTALHRYRGEDLGQWTWVLVHSEDWKPILERVQMDPNSPAFTILQRRQTFFEDVLLVPKPKRLLELLPKWQIGFDEFLDLAVTHELGHALCNDPDERRADRFGKLLRDKKSHVCERSPMSISVSD